jgi:hypothetical protein
MATNIEAPWFVLRCPYYEARLSHSLLVYARISIVEPRHQSVRALELVHESGTYVKFTEAVLDDFGGRLGGAWRETAEGDTGRATLIKDLLDGQYAALFT